MALVPTIMCFVNQTSAHQFKRGDYKWAAEEFVAACKSIMHLFDDMARRGLVMRGPCVVCGERLAARHGGSFEIAVAVECGSLRSKRLGIVCERCTGLPVPEKGEAIKQRVTRVEH
jgi:hypothetical protein